MRLLGWVGLVVAFPTLASAQIPKREDIVGTWVAKVEYTSPTRRQRKRDPQIQRIIDQAFPKGMAMTPTVRATYYPDGLFRFVEEAPEGFGTAHASGRWRLSGDTLWWGTDHRYGNGMIYERGELPEGPVTDTLEWPSFPRNDSLFWTAPLRERKGMPEHGYWNLTAYKVSIKDGRLTMVRIADLSNNDWDPPGAEYERKK